MIDNRLTEAWAARQRKWKSGTEQIVRGNKLWEEIVKLPGSSPVSVWLSISESCHDAAFAVESGYAIRMEGDKIWHDAVVEVCGLRTRVTWEKVDDRGDRCLLSTGEVFEPF